MQPRRSRVGQWMGDTHGKVLVPLLSILAVLLMGVSGAAAYLLIQERDVRMAKESQLRDAVVEIGDLKSRLDAIQEARSKAEDELASARKEFGAMKDQLTQAKDSQETLARSVQDREQEISRLTKELEQTRSQSQQSTARLSELQAEQDTLKQQLAQLEQAKGQLESKVLELSDNPTVQLDKITVKEGGEALATPVMTSSGAHQGQVVVINREYDFIVMNLGKNQGLTVGQEFQIVRDNQVLGRVKVEKVYDELSAAAILPESNKDTIREGDLVRAL